MRFRVDLLGVSVIDIRTGYDAHDATGADVALLSGAERQEPRRVGFLPPGEDQSGDDE